MQTTYVDVGHIAKRLGVSKSTVFRLVRDGKLAHPTKFGHSISRWPESALESFIEAAQEAADHKTASAQIKSSLHALRSA